MGRDGDRRCPSTLAANFRGTANRFLNCEWCVSPRETAHLAFGENARYHPPPIRQPPQLLAHLCFGEVTEWPIVLVSKTSVPARVPRVRIPPSPHSDFDACRNQHGYLLVAAFFLAWQSSSGAQLMHNERIGGLKQQLRCDDPLAAARSIASRHSPEDLRTLHFAHSGYVAA